MDEAIVRILREKEDQIQQLQLDLRRSESKSCMLEDAAQDAEDDAKRIKEELEKYKENVGLRSEGSMRELRGIITRLEGDLADSDSAKNLLQNNVNRLEKLLDEERQSRPNEESFHPDYSICTSHEEEIKSLREEIEEAVQWKLAVDKKMKMLERDLMDSNERADDAMQDGNMLRKSLEEARDQLRNLEGELNDVKHNTHFASKGNSMFSEFVDERKKLENDLKTLHDENLSLRQENRTLLSEIEELSMQKGTGIAEPTRLPCKCNDLQEELYQARIERDKALQACRTSMITSTDELRKAGLLEPSQKKRMAELRDEAKRYYVENDRLRRSNESLKMETMNANVDKNTWKEKFEAHSKEVDRLKDLLNALRRKHSALSRPSNNIPPVNDVISKMCTKPSEVPQTPSIYARPSKSCLTASSSVKQTLFHPVTPATGTLKRPLHELRGEKRLEEIGALENSARAAELSLNSSTSSVRRRVPTKKPKFLTNMVKSEVQAVMRLEVSNGVKIVENSEERSLTPPDENDEKSNSSIGDDKTTLQVKKMKEEEENEEIMDEGMENHDPSFIMSKDRMPADSNLEATILDDTMMNN